MRLKTAQLFLFLVLLQLLVCQQQINVATQLSERRVIDLSTQFQMISNTFQVKSSTQSPFELDQPFSIIAEPVEINYRSPIIADQIFSGQKSQRIEIYSDESSITFSLYELAQSENSNSVKITLLGSNSIKSDGAIQIIKVNLIQQNLGFFSYKKGNLSVPGYFSLKLENNQNVLHIFISQQGSGIFNIIDYFYALFVDTEYNFYFVGMQSGEEKQIILYQMNFKGEIQKLQHLNAPCASASMFSTDLNVFVVCKNRNHDSSRSLFSIKLDNQEITIEGISNPLDDVGKIENIQSFNGKIYIFHHMKDQSNLNLKKIIVSGSKLVQSQNIPLKLLNFQGAYLNINIQSESFIQITTKNYLIGVNSVTGEVLTQFQVPFVNSYNLQSIIPFNSISILNYIEDGNSFTFRQSQILFQKPKLSFYQSSTNQQEYTITFTNKLIPQQLQITSNNLPVDETGLSVLSILKNSFNQNLIISKDNGVSQSFNLEEYIIGSNLQLTQNSKSENEDLVVIGNIYSLSQLKQTNLVAQQQDNFSSQSFRNLQSSITNIINIFSTQSDFILIESLTKYKQVQISLVRVQRNLIDSVSNLQVTQQTILPSQYVSIDHSGFISYFQSNLQFYIKIFAFSMKSNEYEFFDLPLVCKYSEQSNFYFSADILRNLIIVFCEDQITVISYFVKSNKNQLITQIINNYNLNGQITYPIKEMIVSNGILYFTDNTNNINVFNYLHGEMLQKIEVQIFLDKQLIETILYSSSFLLVFKDSNENVSIYQYDYQLQKDQKSAQFLRQINLSGIQNLSSVKALRNYQTQQLMNTEEYLFALSQDLLTVNLFRINNIQAQNQLYQVFKLPFELSNLNYLYFAKNIIGFYNQKFVSYWINEFIMIQAQVLVKNQDKLLETFEYTLNNSIKISNNENISFKYLIQKDVSSKNGEIVINQSNQDQVNLVESYFQKQTNLTQGSSVEVNMHGMVPYNLFGWEISQQGEFVSAQITQNLQINSSEQQKISDQIELMDNFYAYTIGNSLYIDNTLYAQFNDSIQNCFLYIDESTVSTQASQQGLQKSLIFNTLCFDYTKSQIILDAVQFTGIQNSETQQITFKSTNGTYTGPFYDFFSQKNILIHKVYTDSQLGKVLLLKDSKYGKVKLCKYTTDSQSLQLLIDCDYNASSQIINNLTLINSIWIQALSNYIYISANGNIYLNLVDNIQILNLNKVFTELEIYQKSNILTAQQSQQNSFFMSYGTSDVFEFSVSQSTDQSTPFTLKLVNTFKGEQNFYFSGYGATQGEGNYILFMYSAFQKSELKIVSYQPYSSSKNNIYIIQSSVTSNYNSELAINVIKTFKNDKTFSFLALTKDGQNSSMKKLQFNGFNRISIKCQNPLSKQIEGPAAYLKILNSEFKNSTVIPINLSITRENSTCSILQFVSAFCGAIFILLL